MRRSHRALLAAILLILLPTASRPAFAEQGAMHEPTTGDVTGHIGYRCTSGPDSDHYGYDIDNVSGTKIFAAYKGTVAVAGTQDGYGKVVYINHPQGYQTRYAHLSEIHVSEGASVTREQRIGLMGATGNASGAHLHFEIRRNGNVLNRNGHYSCGKHVTAKAKIPVAFPDLPA